MNNYVLGVCGYLYTRVKMYQTLWCVIWLTSVQGDQMGLLSYCVCMSLIEADSILPHITLQIRHVRQQSRPTEHSTGICNMYMNVM